MSDVVCFNAAKTAEEIGASAIIGMTVQVYRIQNIFIEAMRRFLSSDQREIAGTLNLVGKMFYYDGFTTTDDTITDVLEILKAKGRVLSGDVVVFVGSMPLQARLKTNMMKVAMVD